MRHHLSIDLETFSSVPIGKAGAYKYAQSPDFEILLFAYSVDDGPVEIVDLAQGEVLPDWLYKAIESPEYIKHAYNAAFEWYCLSKFYGHLLPVDQWRDTMLHGLYCGYTAGLDATGKALGLPAEKQKLSVGKALIRYFCVPCTPTQSNGGRHRNLPKQTRISGICSRPTAWATSPPRRRSSAGCRPFQCRMTSRNSGRPTCSSTPEAWRWTWAWCAALWNRGAVP